MRKEEESRWPTPEENSALKGYDSSSYNNQLPFENKAYSLQEAYLKVGGMGKYNITLKLLCRQIPVLCHSDAEFGIHVGFIHGAVPSILDTATIILVLT